MKFNRWWWLCTFTFGACLCIDEKEEAADTHRNVPRWFRVFSKGPEAEDERYEGRNVINHLDNALKGGTIGIQLDMKKHLGKLSKLWGKVKKYLSRGYKARSRPEPEDRELEGFLPESLDPRSKWPPSRLVANDRMTDMRREEDSIPDSSSSKSEDWSDSDILDKASSLVD